MTRRPGLSLVEVLVALFIVGLGSIAIMTLFPLGALQMGQALKDDRTAQAAGQADGYMRWYWKNYVIEDTSANYPDRSNVNGVGLPLPPGVLEPTIRAMEDPNDDGTIDTVTTLNARRFAPYYAPPFASPDPPDSPAGPWWYPTAYQYTPPKPFQKLWVAGSGLFPLRPIYPISQWKTPSTRWQESGPSYPVFVDPIGWVNFGASASQFWVGGADLTRAAGTPDRAKIARRTLSAIPPVSTNFKDYLGLGFKSPPAGTPPWTGMDTPRDPQAQRTCSLLDGLGYDQNGAPDVSTGSVQRELRYNWLWVLQKLHQNDDNNATMTVVVFDKRAFKYVPQGAEQLFTPVTFDGLGNPGSRIGSTVVRFPTAPGRYPPVIKGGWIADVTHTTWTYPEPQPLPPGSPPGTPEPVIPQTISAVRNCNFYRVVSIIDNSQTTGTIDIELQVPLKADSQTLFDPYGRPVDDTDKATSTTPGIPGYNRQYMQPQARTFLFLAGVCEVFDRVNLTKNQAP